MNIKFTDEALFEKLKSAAIAILPVGSHAYGTQNEHSDRDLLYVYPTPRQELKSVFQTHHQLQYKDKANNDHLFVSLRSFLTNLVSGDSPLNFEALYTSEIRLTELRPLAVQRHVFNSERMVRTYLGRARKDFKDYNRLEKGGTKTKKLAHMVRSYYFANMIRDQEFRLDCGEYRAYNSKITGTSEDRQEFYANHFHNQIEFLKEKLENEKSYIPVFMEIQHQEIIDQIVLNIMKTKEYKEKRKLLEPFDMKVFYHANEKGIVYTT